MNKFKCLIPASLFAASLLTGCGGGKKTIYIFTAHEENRIQLYNKELKEHFPDYNKFQREIKSGLDLMSELQANGTRSQCDIFVGIEITNAEILLQGNENLFADLSDYDTSNYVDEVL